MEIAAASAAGMATGLAGIEVSEQLAAVWLERVSAKCGDAADRGTVLIAAARLAAADAIECSASHVSKVGAAGLSVQGRTASEAAKSLRRAAMRLISPYLSSGGVVGA